MSDPLDYHVVEAMNRYGGSFVKALAGLYWKADPVNQQRLKDAFPDYWQQYLELARKAQEVTR